MYIIMLTYKKPMEIVEKFLVAHRTFLDEGYQKDYLIVSGPKNPRTGGVIISNLTDKAFLMEFMSQDPFIINDVAEYEYIEFNPVKYHDKFSTFIERTG